MTSQVLKSIAEKALDPVIRLFNFPLAYLTGRSENLEKAILRPVMRSYSRHSENSVYQYTKLPKSVDRMPVEWPDDGRFSDYAIILQGPIRSEDHFTVDTVKYYKRCYSGASVIVSTWTGSDLEAKEEIQNAGAYWVENKVPDYPGAGNINMQLVSSLGGVKKAESLGCRFAMKTRTDQRICANDALQYFRNLQETFPSADSSAVANRLIYIGGGQSYRYIPFYLRDFLVFGETEELEKLYCIQRDTRPLNYHEENSEAEMEVIRMIAEHLESKSAGDPYKLIPDFEEWYYRCMISEIYIVYHYFQDNLGDLKHGDNLLDAYYWYLKNYAIVADSERLTLYWPKYRKQDTTYDVEWLSTGKMTFKKWLEIYLHYQPKKDWSRFAENADNRNGAI